MSEFDDFVDDSEDGGTKHQPKMPKSQNQSQSGSHEPQQSSTPSKSTAQDVDTEPVDTDPDPKVQTEAIADSHPTSWDREQFAMFFKEREVFEYEDQMHDAKGHLKRGYNVRNDKRYEIDQAFIELALERVSPEEIAARLIENRGFEP